MTLIKIEGLAFCYFMHMKTLNFFFLKRPLSSVQCLRSGALMSVTANPRDQRGGRQGIASGGCSGRLPVSTSTH